MTLLLTYDYVGGGTLMQTAKEGKGLTYRPLTKNKLRSNLKFIGPAFVVSVAYIDPGNFATNITGGSSYDYSLLWVIFWSNLMAIFLQTLSAKLGIATEENLTGLCRKVFSKKVNWIFWFVAGLATIATTLAEFLGASLGFYLLFRIPLPIAGLLTGIITFGIVYLQKYGQRLIEIVITILVAIICLAYTIELFLARPDFSAIALGTLVPTLPDSNALLVAVGMLGATVMPHVIYLHSELVQDRNKNCSINQKKKHLKLEKIDIFIAMNIAFIVNAAMVIVSAAVFYKSGLVVDSIEDAHKSLSPLLGSLSSGAFGIALLASGFSSSTVGTMAGETVMNGFVNIKIPTNIKRLVTMVPAMFILAIGVNPMTALVLSQVFLSFALPAAIIPLILLTSKKSIMGEFVNSLATKIFGFTIALVIVVLNCVLLYSTLIGF